MTTEYALQRRTFLDFFQDFTAVFLGRFRSRRIKWDEERSHAFPDVPGKP